MASGAVPIACNMTSRPRDLSRVLVGCSISYKNAAYCDCPGWFARVSFASDPGCPGTASPAACPTGWRATCPPDQTTALQRERTESTTSARQLMPPRVRVSQGRFLPILRLRWRPAASAFAARLTGLACTSMRSSRSRCSSVWSRSRLPTRIRSSSAGWSVRLRCRSCGSSSSPRSSGGCLGSLPAWSSAGARGLDATTEAPLLRDLAACTDQQPPQHVHHERYDDKDEEYLYWSQAHSLIMHRPELSRKPLVGEKSALRVILYPCGGRARLLQGRGGRTRWITSSKTRECCSRPPERYTPNAMERRHSRQEPTYPWKRRDAAAASTRTVSATTMP